MSVRLAAVPGFQVVDATLGDVPGVAVRGEVDLAVTAALTDALDEAVRAHPGDLVVDLTDATFLDSSGVHALLRARALLGREDRSLALVCPPGAVRRVLELVGIEALFVVYERREDVN